MFDGGVFVIIWRLVNHVMNQNRYKPKHAIEIPRQEIYTDKM